MFAICCCKGDQAQPVVESAREEQPEVQDEVVLAPETAEPAGRITVALVSARGLRNADWLPGTGKSDCYCVVKAVGKDEELFRTKVLDDTLEPVWKAESELEGWSPGDSLEFTVYDKDVVTSTKLGKVVLESSEYEGAGFNGELLLSEAGKDQRAYLTLKVKMPEQEYPDGPPTEFFVSVEKAAGKPLGLEFDVLDGISCYVVGIKEGPFQEHNLTADPSMQLKHGDFIMEANGAERSQQILDQFAKDGKIEVKVRRPVEFTVALGRSSADQNLGLEISEKLMCEHLLITSVGEGLAKNWNDKYPDSQVRAGDRIVAVNGKRCAAKELQSMLQAPKITQVTLVRPASLQ